MRHPFLVPPTEKPRAEGRFHLPRGRHLGFAEFGDPTGDVVLWFHGTPGGRRQFPLTGRRTAEKLGLRVVVVERPGVGVSDAHRYHAVGDWVADVAHAVDAVGAHRLAVVGLSGGGPYALACGALPPLADRVATIAVLGGVTPSVGPDATASGVVDLARRFGPVLATLRQPLAGVLSGAVTPLLPFAHFACRAYAGISPASDRRVLHDPEMEGMFVDDLVLAAKGGLRGIVDDARLFGRDWGFRLGDVAAPVRWWHGDADHIVSLSNAHAAVAHLRDAELVLRPEESHLGGFAATHEVLEYVRETL